MAIRPVEGFGAFVAGPENTDCCFEGDDEGIFELPLSLPQHGLVRTPLGYHPAAVCGPAFMLYDDEWPLEDILLKVIDLEASSSRAVEMLSLSNRHGQNARNLTRDLSIGFQLTWGIDPPPAREVMSHRADRKQVVGPDGSLGGGGALPELSTTVASVFRNPGEM
jgi:hypothetical protein